MQMVDSGGVNIHVTGYLSLIRRWIPTIEKRERLTILIADRMFPYYSFISLVRGFCILSSTHKLQTLYDRFPMHVKQECFSATIETNLRNRLQKWRVLCTVV